MFWLVGHACWPAFAINIIFSQLRSCITRTFFKINMDILRVFDKRLKIVNECYKDIRIVKLSATENYFLDRICKLKDKEQNFRKKLFRSHE